MQPLFYNQNDTLPRLEITASGDGAAEDLSSATGVVFLYRNRYSGTYSVISGQFASKPSGIIYVDLTGGSVTQSIGPNWGRFKVYFQNGGVRSFPAEQINFEIMSGLV
mgnify:CR=1 FL=1